MSAILGYAAGQFIDWWSSNMAEGIDTWLSGDSGGTLTWRDGGVCGQGIRPDSTEWWAWPYPPKVPWIYENSGAPLYLPPIAGVLRTHWSAAQSRALLDEMFPRLRTSCGVELRRNVMGPFVTVHRAGDHQDRGYIIGYLNTDGQLIRLPYWAARKLLNTRRPTSQERRDLEAQRDSHQLPEDLQRLDRPNASDVYGGNGDSTTKTTVVKVVAGGVAAVGVAKLVGII